MNENHSLLAQLATEKLRISKLKSVNGFDPNNNSRFIPCLTLSNNLTIADLPNYEIYTELKFEETPKFSKESNLEEYFTLVFNI